MPTPESDADDEPGDSSYVYRVRFRVEPSSPGVSADPTTFETTLSRAADPPGKSGWLFYRETRGLLRCSGHSGATPTDPAAVSNRTA